MGKKGDLLRVMTPGSGGYGDPRERDPARIAEDVANGLVSAESARALYGAVIDTTGKVSAAETRIQRTSAESAG